jgi:hypothetical protein
MNFGSTMSRSVNSAAWPYAGILAHFHCLGHAFVSKSQADAALGLGYRMIAFQAGGSGASVPSILSALKERPYDSPGRSVAQPWVTLRTNVRLRPEGPKQSVAYPAAGFIRNSIKRQPIHCKQFSAS